MNAARISLIPLMLGVLFTLASCDTVTPLHKKQPFTVTAVPADFAVVINENYDTYYARTHIEQIVTADDMVSRTTYTVYRDFNNTISNKYEQDHPLNRQQLQAMWDEVQAQELLKGAWTWTYFYMGSDFYKRDARVIQIRANGLTKSYKQVNHWDGALRELALQVQAVRLPIMGGAGTPLAGHVPPAPAATGAAPTVAATAPVNPIPPATAPAPLKTASTQPSEAVPTDAIGDPTALPATAPATQP